jgi:hypothetical protein
VEWSGVAEFFIVTLMFFAAVKVIKQFLVTSVCDIVSVPPTQLASLGYLKIKEAQKHYNVWNRKHTNYLKMF